MRTPCWLNNGFWQRSLTGANNLLWCHGYFVQLVRHTWALLYSNAASAPCHPLSIALPHSQNVVFTISVQYVLLALTRWCTSLQEDTFHLSRPTAERNTQFRSSLFTQIKNMQQRRVDVFYYSSSDCTCKTRNWKYAWMRTLKSIQLAVS